MTPIPSHMLPLYESRAKAIADWLFTAMDNNSLRDQIANVVVVVEFKDGVVLEADLASNYCAWKRRGQLICNPPRN
jgi:hypothetical protein